MELLNRYLDAVKFWLPRTQQDDIIAELGEDLRSQIEDQEGKLGRPLSEDDLAGILERRGNPMLVAGRYLPQRSLIGPVLYPAYLLILKLVTLWVLPPIFILVVGPATVLSSRNPGVALVETAWTLLMAALVAFGVITLVFAVFERYPHEATLRWDPRRLPRVPAVKAGSGPQPVPRYAAIAELLTGIAFTLLWVDVIWFHTSYRLSGVEIALTPVWRTFFWPLLLVMLSGVPLGLIGWLRPWWMRARSILRLAVDGVILVLLAALGKIGPWVTVSAPSLPAGGVADANHWANLGVAIGFGVISIITMVEAVQEARRLASVKTANGRTPAAIHR